MAVSSCVRAYSVTVEKAHHPIQLHGVLRPGDMLSAAVGDRSRYRIRPMLVHDLRLCDTGVLRVQNDEGEWWELNRRSGEVPFSVRSPGEKKFRPAHVYYTLTRLPVPLRAVPVAHYTQDGPVHFEPGTVFAFLSEDGDAEGPLFVSKLFGRDLVHDPLHQLHSFSGIAVAYEAAEEAAYLLK